MSGGEGLRWELREGEQLVATITVSEHDFPWSSGTVVREPGFTRWAPVFAAEAALREELSGEDSEEGWEHWERLCDPIRENLTLVSPTGPVAEFLLHVEGDTAWFRWADTPFDDEPWAEVVRRHGELSQPCRVGR